MGSVGGDLITSSRSREEVRRKRGRVSLTSMTGESLSGFYDRTLPGSWISGLSPSYIVRHG